MKMVRKPTYSGNVEEKDQNDILFWAFHKSATQRLVEAWRLHCLNYNIQPSLKMDKSFNKAYLKNEQ